jgi:cyclomaltodextrinase / maltogenic alpha-amylase / neopullulanase
MRKSACHHEAKSQYAYNVDLKSMHLKLRTAQGTVQTVDLIHGDPFMWVYDEATDQYLWQAESQVKTPMVREFQTAEEDLWFASIDVPTKRVKYAFLLNDRYLLGSTALVDLTQTPKEKFNLFNYFNYPYLLEADTYQAPSWVKDTVWYQIFPDRFCNLDNPAPNLIPFGSTETVTNHQFFGGNLKGITAKLDYLKDMGFTGIYLTPIFLAPSAHKYDTVDYYQIDPTFGTIEDFDALIEAAHRRGIKIMLDAVFNHVSNLHPFFLDVIQNETMSPYYNSFFIKRLPVVNYDTAEINRGGNKRQTMKELHYETFAFTPRMPKLNTDDPVMRQYLLDVGTYWVLKHKIDGWRLDVANEVSHDFWRDFRKAVKTANPNTFILGENWDFAMPWLKGDQHDAVMNYSFLYPIWGYFGKHPDVPMFDHFRFRDAISETLFQTPKPVIVNMFNLVDSHDTMRVAEVMGHDIELLQLVYLFQFSLPGSPSIYYGGEIGLGGKKDPDNRRCMIWDENKQNLVLKAFLQQLIRVYKSNPAFTSTNFRWCETSQDHLVYQKDETLFFLNKSTLPYDVDTTEWQGNVTDVFANQSFNLGDTLRLKPKSFRVLRIH